MESPYDKRTNMLLEEFKSIKTVKRMFYPRNLSLSPEFISSFKKEFSRLQKITKEPAKSVLLKMIKALPFIANEKL